MLSRYAKNPIITPRDVAPSRPDFEVIGTFNAGITRTPDGYVMLLRVAEKPVTTNAGQVACPYLNASGELTLKTISRADADWDFSDSRFVTQHSTGTIYLTSISHMRLARSSDGINFTVDAAPWLQAQPPYETFGIEDPRITEIDGCYYVNYTAVSEHGIATGLVSTMDFAKITRHGIIFPPANRDVALFPRRINGQYVCYHRPMPGMFGGLKIWCATSPDLVHWGAHEIVWQAKAPWESGRVGGGAPPIETEYGWLSIYHAADKEDRYCLGALLAAADDPARIIAYSPQPILAPEAPYETSGFFKDVVFSCGTVLAGDELRVYYGASDETVALASVNIHDLVKSMQRNNT